MSESTLSPTAATLAEDVRAGRRSAAQLVEEAERLRERTHAGAMGLNAIVHPASRPVLGESTGPLAGVPVAIKDNLATARGCSRGG